MATERAASTGADSTVAEIVELVGGLAHELRNPLSTLMVNLKLLAEDLDDMSVQPEAARRRGLLKVDILRREAERLQQLFDEFLRLAGPCPLRCSPLDLNTPIARLVEFLSPLMNEHGVRVTVESEGPVVCMVDEMLLSQALLNVALNAQQAMPEGGELNIAVCRRGLEAVIEISDSGVGIADSEKDRIFRPFFSTKPGGTGLGLPITRRVIEEHGGTVSFESQVGRGTRFTIRLPLHEGA